MCSKLRQQVSAPASIGHYWCANVQCYADYLLALSAVRLLGTRSFSAWGTLPQAAVAGHSKVVTIVMLSNTIKTTFVFNWLSLACLMPLNWSKSIRGASDVCSRFADMMF